MIETRRFVLNDATRRKEIARAVIEVIGHLDVGENHAAEIIIRPQRKEKTHDMRALWHAVMGEAAPHLGLTPGQTKQLIKQEFFGVDEKVVAGRRYEFVQSSEESDRQEYSRLIDFTLQFLAEQGIHIQDRRA